MQIVCHFFPQEEELPSVPHAQSALQTLPDCVLLHFAYADMEEARGDAAAASAVYERLALRMLPPDQPAQPAKDATEAEETGQVRVSG